MIPIFKTRYSLGRSILTVSDELETKEGQADNCISLALAAGLKEIVFVEDTMSAFLVIYNSCRKHGLKMRFGLRLNFCSDAANPNPSELHKNIVFLKESKGYENLVKVSTFAATHPFQNESLIDYDTFHRYSDGLELVVPYFDSFLWVNHTTFGTAVPDFRSLNPTFLIEKNGLPEDQFMEEILRGKKPELAKSIYYKDRSDIHAFTTRKLMDKSSGKRRSLEIPNLDNFSSCEFSFESWKEYTDKKGN